MHHGKKRFSKTLMTHEHFCPLRSDDLLSTIAFLVQSQKTQGFCVADFATLSDERRSRSKIFPLFIWIKNLAFENLKGSNVRNFLGFRKLSKSYGTESEKQVC